MAEICTEIILALDSDSLDDALRTVHMTLDHVRTYKVGTILFAHHGIESVRRIREAGAEVFLDLKFHDIPNTVRGAVRGAARLGVRLLTIHTPGGIEMMKAALEGAREGARAASVDRPLVIGVTVLTSLAGDEGVEDLVMSRTADAVEAGVDGVVCSAHELAGIRRKFGDALVTVVPGIRLNHQAGDDQARVATPGLAARYGANFIVVGRSVTRSDDPVRTLKMIEEEVRNA